MREFARGVALSLVAAVAYASAAAAEPQFSAVVEDIEAPSSTIQFMDYVKKGQMIVLGPTGTVTLGYFRSCMQETITGGVAIIGSRQSTVSGGTVDRREVECDTSMLDSGGSVYGSAGGQTHASIGGERRTKDSAVVLMRSLAPMPEKKAMAEPRQRIYGLSPVFKLSQAATEIRISRIDGADPDVTLNVQGKNVDLAKMKVALRPGAYTATAGGKSIDFQVDLTAKPGRTPILGRLLRL